MKSFLPLILLGTAFQILHWTPCQGIKANFIDKVSAALRIKEYVYAVIIDAGSTGSRVSVFRFIASRDGSSVKLYKEYYKQTTPGISYYASNPRKAGDQIEELLSDAKSKIPKHKWAKTSAILMATAGLRLLPANQQNGLLLVVRNVFQKSGFHVGANSVSIIDGRHEGLFSWFSLNLLLRRFQYMNLRPAAALDLGGASTQVSFVPFENATVPYTQLSYLNSVTAYGIQHLVYSRSYLGLGLNEARLKILKYKNSNYSTYFQSVCISPNLKTQWEYRGVKYNIRGDTITSYGNRAPYNEGNTISLIKNTGVDYRACERIIENVVCNFPKIAPLRGQEIYAFSGYYYKALEADLVTNSKYSSIYLLQLIKRTKEVCFEDNPNKPFLCLDLIYITVLLRNLLGVGLDDKINFVKTVNGHNVNWGLAVAFLNIYYKKNGYF